FSLSSTVTTDLRAVFFTNENTGIVTGLGGKILRTTNAGSNWNVITSGVTNDFYSVYFANVNTGTTAGTGKVMRTTDGGLTWQSQPITFANDLYSICFASENIGMAVGQLGAIFKTDRGGVGVNQISTTVPEKFALQQNYPNPFNPITVIKFNIAADTRTKISIVDLNGKEVEVINDKPLTRGEYEFTWNASHLSSGIYFCLMETDNFKQSVKMILLK
ncbi:MAG: T9SS type A sorting domain-containing protein, partial [Ignavibacteria bacterium]|nr:T9SS type A sorting domain-containing protein [Ignavibacteria bacterium]